MTKPGESSPLRGRRYQKESYSREEVHALLARTSSAAPSALRNFALVMVLWRAGLRINETLELRPHDFDRRQPEIHVRFGKAGRDGRPKERRVRPGPGAAEAVEKWLAARATFELPPDAPLFCTLTGRKLHSTYVRATLQRLARGAGWTKRCHPHGFRHTFAVTLARAGVSPAVIQRQLGHTSLATTTLYLATLTSEDVADAMDKVEW